jgi:hypothetical protein
MQSKEKHNNHESGGLTLSSNGAPPQIVNSRSSIVKADISRPNSALTEDGLNLGKGPASQCRPFLNISLD